ncbi:HEAT repeat domain-containing protein [Kribbella soli]|uniref:HEAT repeat domain-containing protein n=1 Tax=Kribbella soli TaxID=1124743 RepID=A0A4R0HB20_9ACTN|nr:HEAT repeat domain-containing protein [Kribbella soli]TCC07363.1 HEAT repeat domain-containing protein [Kribbella soli]
MVLRDTDTGPVTIGGMIHREPTDGTLRGRAELIATAGHWPLVESNAGEADESYRCYLLWGVTPALWMMYLEDRTTQTAAIEFFGTDGSEVAEIVRRVTLMFELRPYQRHELLADAAGLSGREKGRAVLRVALAMGSDDDPEYFGAIQRASHDPDPDIRNAAAWSTLYLSNAESLAMLARMAAEDPDPNVRKASAELLSEIG